MIMSLIYVWQQNENITFNISKKDRRKIRTTKEQNRKRIIDINFTKLQLTSASCIIILIWKSLETVEMPYLSLI